MTSSSSSPLPNPLAELTTFLETYVQNHPGCLKSKLIDATVSQFHLQKEGAVYYCQAFALRFSKSNKAKFSNTVCGLRRLLKYDDRPFVICVVMASGVKMLLANTTFVKKVGHSSHRLTAQKIRGSINGSDILRHAFDLDNASKNFEVLYQMHESYSPQESLERIVEATNNIKATGVKFELSQAQMEYIHNAPELAQSLSQHPEYLQLYTDLTRLVQNNKDAILAAGRIDNVNERGNEIEQIITQAGNYHSVEDVSHTLTIGTEVKIDIKTKILSLSSSPKGYNVDKALKVLAGGNTVFSYFFVGVDIEEQYLVTCLVSIFDRTILDATHIQFHWAGRNSRGATQLSGDLKSIFNPDFAEDINISAAQAFLRRLIDMKPQNERG